MSMKILHLSALPVWPLEGKGGMPSLKECLLGHLRGGYEIVLLLPNYELQSDEAKEMFVEESADYEVRLISCAWAPLLAKLRGIVRRLSGGKELVYPLRWIFNLALFFLFTFSFFVSILSLRFVEKHNFDLIYAHNQFASLIGWLAGCVFRAPNVMRLYGTFLSELIHKPLVWLRYPVSAAGFLVPHSLLICGNDGTQGDKVASKLGIDISKFRFWQNGIAPPSSPPQETRVELVQHFGPQLRKESKWIVSCSRLSYWKRIDRMLQALAVCRDEAVNCQLLIAGEGAEKIRLQELAEELDLADYVVWLGAVAHDDVWAIMNNADVFMITNDVTNRCNPLYEAAWAGLPVVSVYDQSTADLLSHQNNALLSDKSDNGGLGASLVHICNDSSLAKKLSGAQKELARSFWTWEERMHTEVMELEKLVYGDEAITRTGRQHVS